MRDHLFRVQPEMLLRGVTVWLGLSSGTVVGVEVDRDGDTHVRVQCSQYGRHELWPLRVTCLDLKEVLPRACAALPYTELRAGNGRLVVRAAEGVWPDAPDADMLAHMETLARMRCLDAAVPYTVARNALDCAYNARLARIAHKKEHPMNQDEVRAQAVADAVDILRTRQEDALWSAFDLQVDGDRVTIRRAPKGEAVVRRPPPPWTEESARRADNLARQILGAAPGQMHVHTKNQTRYYQVGLPDDYEVV
jgi:hypothetical protein